MVAPFTGAWIEIPWREANHRGHVSLPSRERGLKLRLSPAEVFAEKSLPSRERGLKFGLVAEDLGVMAVAPFTGAWIEI